jgi:hypothetical protein
MATKLLAVAVSARFVVEVPDSVTQTQAEAVVRERVAAVVPPEVPAEIVSLSIRRMPRSGEVISATREDGRVEYAFVVTVGSELRIEFADGLRLPVPTSVAV